MSSPRVVLIKVYKKIQRARRLVSEAASPVANLPSFTKVEDIFILRLESK